MATTVRNDHDLEIDICTSGRFVHAKSGPA